MTLQAKWVTEDDEVVAAGYLACVSKAGNPGVPNWKMKNSAEKIAPEIEPKCERSSFYRIPRQKISIISLSEIAMQKGDSLGKMIKESSSKWLLVWS